MKTQERPAPQLEADNDEGDNEEFATLSRMRADAMGRCTRVPGEPSARFRNEKHEDIRVCLLTCMDFVGRNGWQWEDEAQQIPYALSRMEGKEVVPIALTESRQMTGDLDYTKQAGYEFWQVFTEQALRRCGPTHEAENALQEMGFVKYSGDIAQFLREMENLNINARVTGIASRKVIEDAIPENARRQLSNREYVDNGEWLEAVRTVTRAEEDFQERKSLRGGGPSGNTRGEKWKFEHSKPTATAKRVKRQYSAKETADYKAKKAGERMINKQGLVAPVGEVKCTVWAEAHKVVDQKVVDKRKSDNECTGCWFKNHA